MQKSEASFRLKLWMDSMDSDDTELYKKIQAETNQEKIFELCKDIRKNLCKNIIDFCSDELGLVPQDGDWEIEH